MTSLPVLSDSACAPKNSLLDRIEIAAPCPAKWEDMRGDDAQRFCGGCQKSVYNIASMSSFDAEKLIFETEGNLCVRLFRRHDGTVITSDCPVGLAERAWRRARNTALASLSLALVLFTGALVALFGVSKTSKIIETTDGIQNTLIDAQIPVQPLAGAPRPMDLGEIEMPSPRVQPPMMGGLRSVDVPAPKPAPAIKKMGAVHIRK